VLPGDGAVVLAWGSDPLLDVTVAGQKPEHLGNVLYYLPANLQISGVTTFRNDMIKSNIVKSDAAFFNRDPFTINFGRGSATISYRPSGLQGTLAVSELAIGLSAGGEIPGQGKPTTVQPMASIPPTCPNPPTGDCKAPLNGLPDVELFDVTSQAWVRLPHFTQGTRYSVANPARYVDPTSGSVLVRYINDRVDAVSFAADLSITGDVR
jgi:hypothetical protein